MVDLATNPVQQNITLFRASYEQAPGRLSDGRGQKPAFAEAAEMMRKEFSTLVHPSMTPALAARPGGDVPAELIDFCVPSVCGYTQSRTRPCFEKGLLASGVLGMAGRRSVAIVSGITFDSFHKAHSDKLPQWARGCCTPSIMQKLLKSGDSALISLICKEAEVYHCTVGARDFLYLPAYYLRVDAIHDNADYFGMSMRFYGGAELDHVKDAVAKLNLIGKGDAARTLQLSIEACARLHMATPQVLHGDLKQPMTPNLPDLSKAGAVAAGAEGGKAKKDEDPDAEKEARVADPGAEAAAAEGGAGMKKAEDLGAENEGRVADPGAAAAAPEVVGDGVKKAEDPSVDEAAAGEVRVADPGAAAAAPEVVGGDGVKKAEDPSPSVDKAAADGQP